MLYKLYVNVSCGCSFRGTVVYNLKNCLIDRSHQSFTLSGIYTCAPTHVAYAVVSMYTCAVVCLCYSAVSSGGGFCKVL